MLSLIRRMYRATFGVIRDRYSYEAELERALAGCGSVLDVGCGTNSPLGRLSKRVPYSVGVDVFEPALTQSKAAGIHDHYRLADLGRLNEEFSERSFDCVLASDVIEHFPKDAGLQLISAMTRIARKKVIIFTPNGFLPQAEHSGNPYQRHLSGWTVEEFTGMGFRTVGVSGLRALRTEFSEIRWRPKLFWLTVSYLTQLLVRERPKYAFQLLAIKDLE